MKSTTFHLDDIDDPNDPDNSFDKTLQEINELGAELCLSCNGKEPAVVIGAGFNLVMNACYQLSDESLLHAVIETMQRMTEEIEQQMHEQQIHETRQ